MVPFTQVEIVGSQLTPFLAALGQSLSRVGGLFPQLDPAISRVFPHIPQVSAPGHAGGSDLPLRLPSGAAEPAFQLLAREGSG